MTYKTKSKTTNVVDKTKHFVDGTNANRIVTSAGKLDSIMLQAFQNIQVNKRGAK